MCAPSRCWCACCCSDRAGLIAVFVVLPLVGVFVEAFRRGVEPYVAALIEPAALAAIKLTLTVAVIAVPINLVFGVAPPGQSPSFEFPGKSLLTTLIDLPFSVSPVIAGLIYMLLSACKAGWGHGSPTTTSRSCSPYPASCWRRCSSPSPSSRAS